MTSEPRSHTSDAAPGSQSDPRRVLQLALAVIWLLDAALQYQPVMFTKAFGASLATNAMGNPGVVSDPINWTAGLFEHYPVVLNTLSATIQLLIAAGLLWRPTVRLALGASIAWSFAVWWLGEGLGGMLSQMSSPVNGAPGAVILYALLAVLLWPPAGNHPAAFQAAGRIGAPAARISWFALWAILASTALWPENRTPWTMAETIRDAASGQPGWLAAIGNATARLVSWHGIKLSLLLSAVLLLIAVSVYLPRPAWQAGLILASALSATIWVAGEALGGILTGSATDPNSGPLLILLALSFWPVRRASQAQPDKATPPPTAPTPAPATTPGESPAQPATAATCPRTTTPATSSSPT